jgi:hypothetical protein
VQGCNVDEQTPQALGSYVGNDCAGAGEEDQEGAWRLFRMLRLNSNVEAAALLDEHTIPVI